MKLERTKSPLHDPALHVVQDGAKAGERTPYVVYEYWWGGRPFYVGVGATLLRANGRWGHVKNLVRLEDHGIIPPGKKADLRRNSNRVIAELIRRNLPPHEMYEFCRIQGKSAAEEVESARIKELVSMGCVLANTSKNPHPRPTQDVLSYLGI